MAKDGANGGAPPPRGPLPHIKDLTAEPQDIDRNTSLKRLLDMCESALSSAEMMREFKKPANALKEYVRASIIAVQYIKNHRDYPVMQQNRGGDLDRRHSAVLKRIQGLYEVYEGIKDYIQQDNSVTGVQPSGGGPPTATALSNGNGSSVRASPSTQKSNGNPTSAANGLAGPTTNGSHVKTKPVLKPKPQSLHGNALQNQHGWTPSVTNGSTDALTARFASLRGPQASPGQDPRIKTHAFAPPLRPSGPREMPPTQKPKIGIDSSVPMLPKMPPPIFSPVRGNMSQESASLPTSTPRGFSRTGSWTSNGGTPSTQPPSRKDYFSPVIANVVSAEPSSMSRPSMDSGSAVSSPRRSLDISAHKSQAEVIEAEDLMQAMKTAGTVLIIDVRPREHYDEGHIMSSSIICIEPTILTRKDLSADDILQSLVLEDKEQDLFAKRHEFDLVVFYDEDSEVIPRTPQAPPAYALMSLHRALVHLSFECPLKRHPKLLRGGLKAWTDLMGANSLQGNSSASQTKSTRGANKYANHPYIFRRASKYRIQPLKPDDVRAWQETLDNEDKESPTPTFPQTTEEFFRKYPEVPIEPEDMAPRRTPVHQERRHAYMPAQNIRVDHIAPPPQLPARALPRPSHSGLAQGAYHDAGLGGQVKPPAASGPVDFRKIPQGIANPHNWCYANSVLQALLTTRFGRVLAEGKWQRVPRKPKETIEQPQLMMGMLKTIFNWMLQHSETISSKVFMSFCHHVCTQAGGFTELFGDRNQHDASEFVGFILAHVDDESNILRNRTVERSPDLPSATGKSALQFVSDYWKQCHTAQHKSLVDEHVQHLDMYAVECKACNNKTYSVNPQQVLHINTPQQDSTLQEALKLTFAAHEIPDYQCDNCRGKREAVRRPVFPYMPEVLFMSFIRFGASMRSKGGVSKKAAMITWDLDDFDMSPYFLPPAERQWQPAGPGETLNKAFHGDFRYETVAIVQHSGSNANSGHYTSHVRDQTTYDPNAWLECNDETVTRISLADERVKSHIFKQDQRIPYVVIMQRKMSS